MSTLCISLILSMSFHIIYILSIVRLSPFSSTPRDSSLAATNVKMILFSHGIDTLQSIERIYLGPEYRAGQEGRRKRRKC